MNKQSNNRFENEEYSKKKINKKLKNQNFKSTEKDKIIDIIGYKVPEKKFYDQKNKQKKNFIRYKKSIHKNFEFLNQKRLQIQFGVDPSKFKDFKDKLNNFKTIEQRNYRLFDKNTNKKQPYLFSRQRKNANINFLETLFASNFLESQDDIKPYLYNYYSPTATSVSFKQVFSLVYILASRVNRRRIYMYSDQQKVLEYLALLVSEGRINKLVKIGKNTDLKNWLFTRQKDRFLISLSNNISNNFYNLMLKKNIFLTYYVNGFYDSIKKIPVGSYFLRNDLINDFKKIMFFLQFIKKSAKMYTDKNFKKSEKYRWRIRFFQNANKKSASIKKNLKFSLNKLNLDRSRLKSLFKVKFKQSKISERNK